MSLVNNDVDAKADTFGCVDVFRHQKRAEDVSRTKIAIMLIELVEIDTVLTVVLQTGVRHVDGECDITKPLGILFFRFVGYSIQETSKC